MGWFVGRADVLYSMSSARSTQVYVIAFVGSGIIQKSLPAIITPASSNAKIFPR